MNIQACLLIVQADEVQSQNIFSNHPLIHKLGVIRTLNHRAASIISDPEKLAEEQDQVEKASRGCGYPKWAFHKVAKKAKKPRTESGNGRSEKALAKILYVAGVAERIKNVLKSYNISTTFKPIGTLRSKLVKVKDKMPREKLSNLVYGIACGSQGCAATHVGETKQSLRGRLDQHRHKGSNEAQISAVYLHCTETHHSFNNADVVILDREEDWVRRGIKEAIWERVEQPPFQSVQHMGPGIKALPCRLSRDPSDLQH